MRNFLALIVTLPFACPNTLRADAPSKEERKKFQYLAGSTRISLPSEEEPKREVLSVESAQRYIEDAAVAWQTERKCISCHTDGTYLLTRPLMADRLGAPNPSVRAFFEKKLGHAEKGHEVPVEQLVYLAAGLATDDAHVGKRLSDATRRAIKVMFTEQEEDGSWKWPGCWPPLEDSVYHGATVAAMAVGTAPGYLDAAPDPEVTKGIQQLQSYLRTTKPEGTYHRMLLLWAACRWPDLIAAERKQQLIESTLEAQRPDGGWSLRTLGTWEGRRKRLDAEPDRDDPPSDGHATGLAILVLREAGIPADHPRIKKGIAWLKSNQRESGRWWTRSLNTDTFSFITYSGTCYPLLALHACNELPAATASE